MTALSNGAESAFARRVGHLYVDHGLCSVVTRPGRARFGSVRATNRVNAAAYGECMWTTSKWPSRSKRRSLTVQRRSRSSDTSRHVHGTPSASSGGDEMVLPRQEVRHLDVEGGAIDRARGRHEQPLGPTRSESLDDPQHTRAARGDVVTDARGVGRGLSRARTDPARCERTRCTRLDPTARAPRSPSRSRRERADALGRVAVHRDASRAVAELAQIRAQTRAREGGNRVPRDVAHRRQEIAGVRHVVEHAEGDRDVERLARMPRRELLPTDPRDVDEAVAVGRGQLGQLGHSLCRFDPRYVHAASGQRSEERNCRWMDTFQSESRGEPG